MNYKISDIIKKLDTKKDLTFFKEDEIVSLEKMIYEKNDKLYLKCYATDKEYPAKPEEIVQQLFINRLMKEYGYPKERIGVRVAVAMGRDTKQADVVVYQEDRQTPWIIAEFKEPHQKNNIQQLKSYLNAKGSPIGIALNGKDKTILFRPYPLEFSTLRDLPYEYEYQIVKDDANPSKAIRDIILNRKWTLKELTEINEQRIFDLKTIIQDLEELVLANSGFDSFTEVFKLVYAKLFDEKEARSRKEQQLFFRQYLTPDVTFKEISKLFNDAKKEWKDIFEPTEKIKLTPEHLDVCVGDLTEIRLFESNLRIIDEAFEYLISSVSKGAKGQYFTPRVVIDACVKILNPGRREYVIDPACGSAGFLVHALRYSWNKYNMSDWQTRSEYAGRFLWGIDFDEKTSKISRAIMLISGDGKTHIYRDNSLMHNKWTTQRLFHDLQSENLIAEGQKNKELLFDIVMCNPPFAGDIREKGMINLFEDILGYKYSCKIDYSSIPIIIRQLKSDYGVKFKPDAKLTIKETLKKINADDEYNLEDLEEDERYSMIAPDISQSIIEALEEPDSIQETAITPKLRKHIRFKVNKNKFDKVERHILFVERVIDMLRPGGRAVIVLPQGIFNNANQKYLKRQNSVGLNNLLK